MKDVFPLPHVPGYVDIKEAAKILGVAESSIYRYIQAGRLPAYQAGRNIMIEAEALNQFKPINTGRPRTNVPTWRITPDESALIQTSITVQVREGKQKTFQQKLEEIRNKKEHLFPGTVARYIAGSNKRSDIIEITFIWRTSVMPDEATRQEALKAFQDALADVVDWTTARYDDGTVFMHA
jgi:excisionase family DNA binding protein